MKPTVNFFEESEGVQSATRLKTIVAAFIAFIIALSAIFMAGVTIGDALPLIFTLLGYSAGEKVVQKFAEVKGAKK